MRKRPRPTCSFRPATDELEKLRGASALVFGELAAAALGSIDQPTVNGPEPLRGY